MNYAAIWHRPSSEYAFALDDTHYVFRLRAQAGDLVKGIDTQADVVFANIIADAVIMLSRAVRAHMKPGGVFICSGIILEREQDVLDALSEAGFTVDRIEHRGEWSAIAAR